MEKRYSIYEARAKFSELVRLVLSHGPAVITQRGIPVIRMLPYEAAPENLIERLSELEKCGRARLAKGKLSSFLDEAKDLRVKPGAVRRFLEDRE